MAEGKNRKYRQSFNALVVGLCKKLTSADCEDVYHIYKDTNSLPEIQLRAPDTRHQLEAIRLFRRLEEQGVFSYLHPKKLVEVFELIQKPNLCCDVEEFIGKSMTSLLTSQYR